MISIDEAEYTELLKCKIEKVYLEKIVELQELKELYRKAFLQSEREKREWIEKFVNEKGGKNGSQRKNTESVRECMVKP